MGVLGDLNAGEYASGVGLFLPILIFIIGFALFALSVGIIREEGSKGIIHILIIGIILMLIAITFFCVSSSTKKSFYEENGKRFLEDVGIQIVEEEKYKETDKLSSDLDMVEKRFKYKGEKIKKLHIGKWLNNGSETPDLQIKLENGSTILIEYGETLLERGDSKEQDLYFLLELEVDEIPSLSKKGNQWVINSSLLEQVTIIRGEEELEKTIHHVNN